MLFNSAQFLLLFLPVALAGFFLLGRLGTAPAMAWLTLCSLFFYASWEPKNLILLGGSAVFNYAIGRLMMRYSAVRGRLLVLGVLVNVGILGYFKYTDFFIENINTVFGAKLAFLAIALPLAISFFTFQKIAYLADIYNGQVQKHGFFGFLLFVFFFPQLIAGPIVHYREVVPQFARLDFTRFQFHNVAAGVLLFAIGLCKKSVFADTLATFTVQPFQAAAGGSELSFVDAWGAVLAFTYQVYFDFSAYSDMAIGIALMLNVRLPLNFDSPLQATSILDLWRRWHMTLTRFLTDYVYTPLSFSLTRKTSFLRKRKWLVFVCAVGVPLNLTFLVSGLWHGAGWTFVMFGVFTGIAITVNSAWRQARLPVIPSFPAWVLTMLTFVVSVVFFRAESLASATSILKSMCGLNGFDLPTGAKESLGALGGILAQLGVTFHDTALTYFQFPSQIIWLVVIAFVVHTLPNSQQIAFRFLPDSGGVDVSKGKRMFEMLRVEEKGKLLAQSGIAGATLGFFVAVWILGVFLYQSHLHDGIPEFIYFQF